jgi:hypothetical protein
MKRKKTNTIKMYRKEQHEASKTKAELVICILSQRAYGLTENKSGPPLSRITIHIKSPYPTHPSFKKHSNKPKNKF